MLVVATVTSAFLLFAVVVALVDVRSRRGRRGWHQPAE
jgi:hypothetical protein